MSSAVNSSPEWNFTFGRSLKSMYLLSGPLTHSAIVGVGVMVVASQGDLAVLLEFKFNIGDIGLVIACLSYAIYTLMLRNRPKVSGVGFFAIVAMAAFIVALRGIVLKGVGLAVIWPQLASLVVYAGARHSLAYAPSTQLGPSNPVLVADWMLDTLNGKHFPSERWDVKASGEVVKSALR